MLKTKGPRLLKPKTKKKLKGKIASVSVKKTWFSEAMDELEKKDKAN